MSNPQKKLRNPMEFSFIIYTPRPPIKIYFERPKLRNPKRFLLIGKRYDRFSEFNRLLNTQGYSTLDMS